MKKEKGKGETSQVERYMMSRRMIYTQVLYSEVPVREVGTGKFLEWSVPTGLLTL